MLALLHTAGGVALLLFGIRYLNKGLDRLFGDRLDVWLARLTGGAARAAAFGLGLSLMAPSSTTISFLSVSMVQGDRLTLRQAIAVMLGANIGITLTVYLIAFNLFEHAPILFLVGVTLFVGSRVTRVRGLGQVLIALGLIFTGVAIVRDSTAPVARAEDLRTFIDLVSKYPWLIAISGMVLTVMFQSSTATLALLLGLNLSMPDTVGIWVALPMLLGANAGTSLTTLIAGWREVESRRLGFAMFGGRSSLAAVLLLIGEAVLTRDGNGAMPVLPWQIATMHTGFNVIAAAIWLPLCGWLASAATAIVRQPPRTEDDASLTYLDERWADDPHVAFTQTSRQIAHMARLVVQMLREFWRALKTGDEEACYALRARDDRIDRLNRQIKHFLTRQLTVGLTDDQAARRVWQLRFLDDLETIGDVIDRNLVDVALKRIRKGVRFSEEGWQELKGFFGHVIENVELASAAFISEDAELARKLLRHKDVVRDEEIRLRAAHFKRLQEGHAESLETTDLHLEILTQLKHINHLCSGVAYAVLEKFGPEPALNGEPAASETAEEALMDTWAGDPPDATPGREP